jgi:ABC-type phosphate/phosphonate transport system, permease component
MIDPAANQPYRISPSMRGGRCWACWTLFLLLTLLLLSVLSLDLEIRVIFQADSLRKLANFVGELFPPNVSPDFLERIFHASLETLAMSALGTLLAMLFGLILAVLRHPVTSILLNVLRAIPDLVWAALLLISAGLGPFAGTLALTLHTTGVLGRLFSEAP